VQADRLLISRCVDGEADAIHRFQQAFGELIYAFPIRAYRLPPEEAGDFYVYAFERGRIFRRLRTFEGRRPLRTYLTGCVLDNLVLEWKRGLRSIDSVPLTSTEAAELPRDSSTSRDNALANLLGSLEADKGLLVKLLFIEDFALEPPDVRRLARMSGRPIRAVLAGVEKLRGIVREREARLKQTEDGLDSVQGWLRLYDRGLRQVREQMAARIGQDNSELVAQAEELERKYAWRIRQRASLLARAQRRKVTAPYKEIAELLNVSVGTLGSRIKRLRDEIARAGIEMSD
jgi:RNA polymerase sigma factor (sigma-70 family)